MIKTVDVLDPLSSSPAGPSPDRGAMPAPALHPLKEILAYGARIKKFTPQDWLRYSLWIGSILGLFLATTSFVVWGWIQGVVWPGYVWFIPVGTFMFGAALSFDDIGHRTIYKNYLKQGEGYIHQMIVATAVPSVMALCLCYEHGETFKMPALVLILLSFFYSAIDEAMHWYRYFTRGLDRVEMWSHFVAITGHALMIACWWHWFQGGYPGVAETLASLP